MIDKIALPTVGRIVLLHDVDHIDAFPAMVVGVGPGALSIAYLHVFLHDGARALQDVKHASEALGGEPYWDWMPYQKGQAAKTEELQRELDAKLSAQRAPGAPHRNSREMDLRGELGTETGKTQASTASPEDDKR